MLLTIASNAQSPVPGFVVPFTSSIPCFAALAMALLIMIFFSFSNRLEMTSSDEFFGLKVESLAGVGGGSRNGSADEGLFRDFFSLLLLGILTENRICMGK